MLADQQERATAGAVEHQAALQRLQADMERREDSAARRLRLLERRAERDRRVWGDEHADEMGQMQEQVPPPRRGSPRHAAGPPLPTPFRRQPAARALHRRWQTTLPHGAFNLQRSTF